MSELKDQEIIYNLLFLVQALRYEGETVRSNLLDMLIIRATSHEQIASLLYWYLRTESDAIQGKDSKVSKETEKNIRLYKGLFGVFMKSVKDNYSIQQSL